MLALAPHGEHIFRSAVTSPRCVVILATYECETLSSKFDRRASGNQRRQCSRGTRPLLYLSRFLRRLHGPGDVRAAVDGPTDVGRGKPSDYVWSGVDFGGAGDCGAVYGGLCPKRSRKASRTSSLRSVMLAGSPSGCSLPHPRVARPRPMRPSPPPTLPDI